MDVEHLHDLVERIEAAAWPDEELAAEVMEAMKSSLPAETGPITIEPGLLTSTDRALHLASLSVPNWSIELHGYAHEPGSHWTCTLREGTVRDDDELIGIGKGPTPPLALVAALIRILVIRAQGRW